MSIAHKLNDKIRTGDVLISEEIHFSSLLLSDCVLRGLQDCGFERPSPIQLKAIPLGRCGLDLIVQAKSGTGKTCVFSVIALESIQVQSSAIQVLVLAPTREIAIQIWEVIKGIGGAMPALRCHTFIGGLPLSEDKQNLKKCHIAVGSPGRIKQLIENGLLKTDSIRLFVLDEADKLLEESFQEQINWIYSALPDNKQMLALSATYPEYLAQHLTRYMRNPTFMRLNITDPALLGIRQYYKSVTYSPMVNVTFENKTAAVVELLSGVSFQQCLIFSNLQTRAQNLSEELQRRGWPTACIAGCLDQRDRIEAMSRLKSYKCRILISTDLTSRGIDADKVNLVINLDVPPDHETYLHRIGRAGRFGSFGGAVSVVSSGKEELELRAVEKKCNTHITQLPDPLPVDLLKTTATVKLDDMVSTEQLITRPTESHDLIAANQKQLSDQATSRKNLAVVSVEDDWKFGGPSNGADEIGGTVGELSTEQAGHYNGSSQDVTQQQNTKSDLPNGLLQVNGNSSDGKHQLKTVSDKSKSESMESATCGKAEDDVNIKTMHKPDDSINRATVNKAGGVGENRGEDVQEKIGVKEKIADVQEKIADVQEMAGTGQRPIAKAKRKRKVVEKAKVPECPSREIPTSVEVPTSVEFPVSVEMHSGGEAAASRLRSVLADRAVAREQTRPQLTLPGVRDRLGCCTLQRPHSYTSALVDYERFLEEGSSGEVPIDTSQLIIDKMDLERKRSTNKELTASINDCIDNIYACVLTVDNEMTPCDAMGEAKSFPVEVSVPVCEPCVQKCSKSTQTSDHTRTYNKPRAVRYHPMSVSSLCLSELGPEDSGAPVESKSPLPDEVSYLTHKDILTRKKDLCLKDSCIVEDMVVSNVQGNTPAPRDTSDTSRLVEKSRNSVLTCDQTREDCELMYVSERVGTVSLTPHTVTVEPELLQSLDLRPKSRKGKHTADLDGYEYGRNRGGRKPRNEYRLGESNSEDCYTSTSDSDSDSSSSSQYEKEVFCNNYFEEPISAYRGRKLNKTDSKRKPKLSKGLSNEEDLRNPSYRSDPYAQWFDWYSSQEAWSYPPWYSAPYGYYPPYSYMYPYPSTPYWPPSVYPHGVGRYWGGDRGDGGERTEAMRRNMDLQRQYIRDMARSTS